MILNTTLESRVIYISYINIKQFDRGNAIFSGKFRIFDNNISYCLKIKKYYLIYFSKKK